MGFSEKKNFIFSALFSSIYTLIVTIKRFNYFFHPQWIFLPLLYLKSANVVLGSIFYFTISQRDNG